MGSWHEPLLKGAKIPQSELETTSKEVAASAQKTFLTKRTPFLATDCPACADKYYSEPCPVGWQEGEDGMCMAPSTYTGICSKKQSFVGGSAVEKNEVEATCGICWPCGGPQEEDIF